MYLAVILGLCAFAPPFTGEAAVLRAEVLPLVQESPTQQVVPPPESSQKTPEKKPPTAAPPQEPSQPGGEGKTEPAASSQAPAPEVSSKTSSEQPKATEKAQSKATTATKKHRRRKHVTASDPNAAPEKKVVRNGGTGDPVVRLAPGMSQEQASRQRQSTTDLLAATDANLKQISGRQLNPSQQDSLSQIRKYMEQAQEAEKAGDVQRAHNLASKALLLSDDVAKH
jgi:hypothetical protein